MTGAARPADGPRPHRRSRGAGLDLFILLGIGLGVLWTGAVLFEIHLPGYRAYPRVGLPPLPDAGVLPGEVVPAATVRLDNLRPLAGQGLFAVTLTSALVLLQLTAALWARAAARTHEMAVRRVLGPTLVRLVGPLLRAGAGIVARGLAAATVVAAALVGDAWINAPPGTRPGLGVDPLIALPASLILIGSVLVFGLLPAAVPSTRALGALRVGGRATPRRSGGAAVTLQVAVSVALLYGGALQYRNHAVAGDAAPSPSLARFDLGDASASPADLYASLRGLGAAMTTPGAALGLAPRTSVLTECPGCTVAGLETPLRSQDSLVAHVTPTFFSALGMEVLDGRALNHGDGPTMVLVNDAFVRTGKLGQGSPVGRTLRLASEPMRERTVVGVISDIPVAGSLSGLPRPTVYVPWPDVAPVAIDVLVPPGGASAPPDVASTLRRRVPSASRVGPVLTVAGARERADGVVAWLGRLVAVSGLIALLVAGVGTYQATASSVRRRRRELGVRLALGATPRRLVTHVAAATLAPVARGAVLSVILLVLVVPDPAWRPGLFAAILGLMVLLALVGAAIPARAAAAVPPDASLRG